MFNHFHAILFYFIYFFILAYHCGPGAAADHILQFLVKDQIGAVTVPIWSFLPPPSKDLVVEKTSESDSIAQR